MITKIHIFQTEKNFFLKHNFIYNDLVEQPPQVKPHTPGEQILMVDTSNLSHQEYQSNQEIKVNKFSQIGVF